MIGELAPKAVHNFILICNVAPSVSDIFEALVIYCTADLRFIFAYAKTWVFLRRGSILVS